MKALEAERNEKGTNVRSLRKLNDTALSPLCTAGSEIITFIRICFLLPDGDSET